MSAREQIPPQYKLNAVPEFGKKGPEAETGNTLFMPVQTIDETLGIKSVQLSTSGDESESRRSGAGIVSQDGTRKRLKTS